MNFKFLALITVFSLTIVAASAQQQYLKNADDARDLSKKASELFKENKISDLIKVLKPYWPLPQNEMDNVEEKTIKTLNMVEERFGKSESVIKIKEETIKDFAIREVYFVKYKNTAIRLMFSYYKDDAGWMVNGFKWDDKFDEEFK
jgi:hypothetical protein